MSTKHKNEHVWKQRGINRSSMDLADLIMGEFLETLRKHRDLMIHDETYDTVCEFEFISAIAEEAVWQAFILPTRPTEIQEYEAWKGER